jgi:DNA (cytosine-5)-methyltransferase 1
MIALTNDHVIFEPNPDVMVIMVDLFAGAGGVTTGAEKATIAGKKVCRVIAAVNHDRMAIESHAANHPNTYHFIEDIRTIDISKLQSIINDARKAYPNASLVIWASLECTNFSKAKGGQPRDADSRTLANFLFRYMVLNPDAVLIENVKEFMAWGPLDENGKPESMTGGKDYLIWVDRMQSYGYDFGWRMLNSANFGAYTSRERFFAQFVKPGIAINWPDATHSKVAKNDMFSNLKKWKPVREVLDLKDEGNSIFAKNYSPKTYERIYAGLVKFVANGDDAFLQKYFSGRPHGKVISINGPAGTITTSANQSVVKAVFLMKYNSTAANGDVKHSVADVEMPSPVIATQPRVNLIQAFLMQYHGNGININIEGPATTITTRDRLAVIKVDPFILPGNFSNQPKNIDMPCPTLVASRRHHYLVNPQFNSKGNSIEQPCFTLIAKMDKRPPQLATAEQAPGYAIVVYEDDIEIVKKIKYFMAEYSIIDIKIRMLKVPELKKIMGFPEDYHLAGNQTNQKKFIGNAVETTTARRIIESYARIVKENAIKVA